MKIVKVNLLKDVRRIINQMILSSEISDEYASRYSDGELYTFMDSAAIYIAARVRKEYLSTLVYNVPAEFIEDEKYLRCADGFYYNSIKSTRRTFEAERKLAASGMRATDESPIYVNEDCEIVIKGDDIDLPSSSITVVRMPTGADQLEDKLYNAVLWRTVMLCIPPQLAQRRQEIFMEQIKPYILPK